MNVFIYKLGMLMYRCQHNKAPRYLMDHSTSVSDVAYRRRLRSASSHKVSVPRHRLSTYGRRAFAVAGPTVWNSLPEDMRDPDVSEDSYRQLVPRRRRGGRVLDRQCVAWASGGVGAERRAACDAACESLGTWI